MATDIPWSPSKRTGLRSSSEENWTLNCCKLKIDIVINNSGLFFIITV